MIEINQQRPEVGLVPAGLDGRPGQRGPAFHIAPDVDAAAVNVVGDVLEPRVVAQDERQIAQRVLDAALLVHLQFFLPVFICELCLRRLCFQRVQIAKLQRGLFPALLGERAAGGLVLRGVFLHPPDGGVLIAHAGAVRGRAARREQMPAHQIECVAQLAARRIGRVMGEGVLVVVHDQPARGAAAHEGVAVVLCGRGVPVGEDVFEDVGNRMRPAERPDDAALGQRVFLLGDRAAHLCLHRLGGGPEGGVLPVGISG